MQPRVEVGKVAKASRHKGQAPYLGANSRRMSTRTMHIARFPFSPFPYRRDCAIISIGAVFLRRISTANGAMRIFFDHSCAIQLRTTSHTVYSTEVFSLFPAGSTMERRKQILTSRTSGAIAPRHCEHLNYLN